VESDGDKRGSIASEMSDDDDDVADSSMPSVRRVSNFITAVPNTICVVGRIIYSYLVAKYCS